jgi:hypothetical protein
VSHGRPASPGFKSEHTPPPATSGSTWWASQEPRNGAGSRMRRRPRRSRRDLLVRGRSDLGIVVRGQGMIVDHSTIRSPDNEGMLRLGTSAAADGSNANIVKVHEGLFSWPGWSLTAPRSAGPSGRTTRSPTQHRWHPRGSRWTSSTRYGNARCRACGSGARTASGCGSRTSRATRAASTPGDPRHTEPRPDPCDICGTSPSRRRPRRSWGPRRPSRSRAPVRTWRWGTPFREQQVVGPDRSVGSSWMNVRPGLLAGLRASRQRG